MAMKNGSFLYELCIKNLQIYGQRTPQNVLAEAYFFAILPNCQHPKPNCEILLSGLGNLKKQSSLDLTGLPTPKDVVFFWKSLPDAVEIMERD